MVSQAERGAVSPAVRPGPARRAIELERLTWPQRPPPGAGRHRGVDHALGEQRVVDLLSGLVALVGLLVGMLG